MALSTTDQVEVTGAGDPNFTTLVPINGTSSKAIALFILWYESIPTAGGFEIDTVECDGLTMTKAAEQVSGGVRAEIWTIVSNALSSGGIEIFWGGDTTLGQYTAEIAAVAFNSPGGTNVDFGIAVGAVGSGTTASVSVSKVGDSGTVYALAGISGVSTIATSETILYENADVILAWSIAFETTPAAPGASPSLAWTVSAPGDDWNAIGIEVQENLTAVSFLTLLGVT